jgi:hypothetical protein
MKNGIDGYDWSSMKSVSRSQSLDQSIVCKLCIEELDAYPHGVNPEQGSSTRVVTLEMALSSSWTKVSSTSDSE